jgi:organic hydroperoxide reductase OsmC/OhrA
MSVRERLHDYAATVTWTGPEAGSTKTYAGYSREHEIAFDGKDAVLRGSADGSFRGDASLVNPEELLVASLSACHMLSYLAVCALEGIEIVSYVDRARGQMAEVGGAGRFVSVTLEPRVTIARAADRDRAIALHANAHEVCFIANSVNFPVTLEPETIVTESSVR